MYKKLYYKTAIKQLYSYSSILVILQESIDRAMGEIFATEDDLVDLSFVKEPKTTQIEISGDSVFVELSEQIYKNISIQTEDPILCKIPNKIRANHEKEYEPDIIAIGPYHRNGGGHLGQINPRLKHMEDMKLKFLSDLCKATANINGVTEEDVLKNITTAVQEKAIDAQKKYSESSFDMSSKDFVNMLILDGSFIVQFFIKGEIPMMFKNNAINSLIRDLLLFENQIPFFILEAIFGICKFPLKNHTFLELALSSYYGDKITLQMFANEYQREENPERIDHLLHLSHICLVEPLSKEPENHVDETLLRNLSTKFIHVMTSIPNILKLLLFWTIWWPYLKCCDIQETPRMLSTIPNATRLREYGITFRTKKIRGNYDTFLDVSFKDGIMEIPHLVIEDNTISKFRNLLALEQSSKKYGNKFARYISFMDDLIDKDSDVALLMNKNIIGNFLGSTERLANMFIEMCDGLCLNPNKHYLIKMYEEINEHCNRPVNKWWAKLMHRYFNSPWSMISLFGVFFFLTFTLVQTVYSIKSFNNGN